jgi:coatomer protein complex subunit gamma
MVYLIIKEICPSADEVIIVTSSLMKDMNSKNDLYRANSIRVLCCIADSAMLCQIERYLKQAIVDRSDAVSSAALVSATHLTHIDLDIVRRWSSEIQEALNSSSPGVQFHALGLLYEVRKSDRLAINKMVTQLTRAQLRSPLAQCLLIRFVAQVISDSQNAQEFDSPFFNYLQNCLRHKSEMVVFEAVRAITNLREVNTNQLSPVITVLQLMLSSPKPSSRFASMSVINKLAFVFPDSVCSCNADIESLISDENKSIATLAVTTLLKTGCEAAIERLLKRIHSFMAEIQDDFKIMVVEAVRVTCIRCSHKYRTLLSFLSTHLREEGGFEYKRAIVHAIIQLFGVIPEAKELSLSYLSEFIEDCEYTNLSCEILYLLGEEAPDTTDPGKYLRYIYNRVVLENPSVRAAAVSAMTNIGLHHEFLRERILILLRRCLFDTDDEVRDRASSSIASLGKLGKFTGHDVNSLDLRACLTFETVLLEYCKSHREEAIDLKNIVEVNIEPESEGANSLELQSDYTSPLSKISTLPDLIQYGAIFKSSSELELTEDETEYKIKCIKHVFSEHVIFEFLCKNTIEEQRLTNVSVSMESLSTSGFRETLVLPLDFMPLNDYASTFSIFALRDSDNIIDRFACTLKFLSKEVDPITGFVEDDGYEDEYSLEDVYLNQSDFIRSVHLTDFASAWDDNEDFVESTGVRIMDEFENIQTAAQHICTLLGLAPCSTGVAPNARSHVLCCGGELPSGQLVLIRVYFNLEIQTVKANITCKSFEDIICSSVVSSLVAYTAF